MKTFLSAPLSQFNITPKQETYHIPEEQYQFATNKLLYEISFRRKEFLNLCSNRSQNYSSKILIASFREVLDIFTTYLNDFEKSLIINKYSINDTFIDYEYIEKLIPNYRPKFSDKFLQHKNRSKSPPHKSLSIDLLPIEKMNAEVNEENFLIKVAKELMKYILVNATDEGPNKYMDSLFKKHDLDKDNKFTLGELQSFLTDTGIYLEDSDFRFFFEKFHIFRGRIDCEQISDFIQNKSQKNYSQTAKTDFGPSQTNTLSEYIKNEQNKDETYFNELMNKNYIINVLRECILIFGKNYLYSYFGKYIQFHNNQFHIENNYIELGIVSLGYKKPSPLESNNFKLICVNKKFGVLKTEMNVTINLEKLFVYIIDYFKMEKLIKSRTTMEIINKMSIGYINKMNESFLLSVTDHLNKTNMFDSKINEFEFRRKFIKSFDFIDHDFFSEQIHKLGNKKFINGVNDTSESGNTIKPNQPHEFKLQNLDAKNYLQFAFNITFIALIRNYLSLGLLINDDKDILALGSIADKIQNKLFPIENTELNKQNSLINTSTLGSALPKHLLQPNLREERDTIILKQVKKPFILNSYRNEQITIDDMTSKQNNEINKLREESASFQKQNINQCCAYDTMNVLPTLFEVCKNYVENKYQIKIDEFSKVNAIGIGRIFKDEVIMNGYDVKQKISKNLLMEVIERIIPNEECKRFLDNLAQLNMDGGGNIIPYTYFGKIEDVLIQYYKHFYNEKNIHNDKVIQSIYNNKKINNF